MSAKPAPTWEQVDERDPGFGALVDALTAQGFQPRVERLVVTDASGAVIAEQGEHPIAKDKRVGRTVEVWTPESLGWGKTPSQRASDAAYASEVAAIAQHRRETVKAQGKRRAKDKLTQKIKK